MHGYTAEEMRLNALREVALLDTPPEEAFDRITRLAAQLFDLPIAAVSLTDHDRQWFKSRVGVSHNTITRTKAPCAEAAETCAPVVIPDLLSHPVYHDSALADGGIRFYAGVPLVTRDGFGLGALCVLGLEPRQVSPRELAALTDLANMVMGQIELQHAFDRVDSLSGLPNRNQFIEDMQDLAGDRPDGERRLAVLVDLASPQQISSAIRVMGSGYLDELVGTMARTMRTMLGDTRRIYHVATTQFVFLASLDMDECQCATALEQKLGEICSSVGARFVTTTAIGVAPFAVGRMLPGDVLRIAHSAAEDARASDSRVSIYSATQDRTHRRHFTLLNAFGTALETPDQLRLVYQPRIALPGQRCIGAEALLRWNHPTLGPVSPAEFMPLVEQTALARTATSWVLDQAMAQLAKWRNAGIDLNLSVNVSAANLLEKDFADRVIQGLQSHGLAAEWLELEMTESAVMENGGQALSAMQALADAGIKLAIDDFGTGYSSLSYLQTLPAHVVKIDQSFMRDLATDERRRTLVSTMISLSHELGYRVVAEGVETLQMLEVLDTTACDEAQGYLFGRPMPAAEFERWYENQAGPAVNAFAA